MGQVHVGGPRRYLARRRLRRLLRCLERDVSLLVEHEEDRAHFQQAFVGAMSVVRDVLQRRMEEKEVITDEFAWHAVIHRVLEFLPPIEE